MLRTSILLATLGTLGTAALTARRGAGCCSTSSSRSRRCCSARRWRRPTPPPCSPCCADRRCGGKHRAHAGGRVGHQRPDRDPARDRLHRGDRGPDVRARGRAAAGGARAVDRLRGRPGGRRRGGAVPAPRAPAVRRPATRSRRWRPARSRSAPRSRCTGRASWPCSSPGSCSAPPSTPARRTIITFHDGLAWVAQLGLFLTLGLLVFPTRAGRHRAQGGGDRARDRGGRAAARGGARDAAGPVSTSASG